MTTLPSYLPLHDKSGESGDEKSFVVHSTVDWNKFAIFFISHHISGVGSEMYITFNINLHITTSTINSRMGVDTRFFKCIV